MGPTAAHKTGARTVLTVPWPRHGRIRRGSHRSDRRACQGRASPRSPCRSGHGQRRGCEDRGAAAPGVRRVAAGYPTEPCHSSQVRPRRRRSRRGSTHRATAQEGSRLLTVPEAQGAMEPVQRSDSRPSRSRPALGLQGRARRRSVGLQQFCWKALVWLPGHPDRTARGTGDFYLVA